MDSTLTVVVFACAFKLLLLPSYYSTDFEVHRNWLALTHTLPFSKWYFEDTSIWTLDYPPLFAWFEWLLSQAAVIVDPGIVQLDNLNYESWQCVLFQRVTVIIGDFALAYAVKEYLSTLEDSGHFGSVWLKGVVLSVLILFNTGLLLVDHIHFQYNGMLFGILLFSIAKLKKGNVLCGAFWFAVLLNFKHIYLYIAPAYFVYLLRSYCFEKSGCSNWLPPPSNFLPRNFVKLSFVVIAVFAVSFGPFLALGQLNQVLIRLFPFKRGLTHAYWAPNFWALYNFADKVAVSVGSYIGLPISNVSGQAALTGGLVGDIGHSVLPTVSPLPALLRVWKQPHDFDGFVRCIVLCGLGSFLFGWHVHEKAILLVLVPLSLLAVCHYSDAGMYVIVSTTGHVSLFPLLFLQAENPLRVILTLLYLMFSYYTLMSLPVTLSGQKYTLKVVHSLLPVLYLVGMAVVQFYCIALHPFTPLGDRLHFLPLMITSVYCSLGVVAVWLKCYFQMLQPMSGRRAYSS